jgi:hypothetical protein
MLRERASRSLFAALVAALALGAVLVSSSSAQRTHRGLVAPRPWSVEKRALLQELAILRRPQKPSDLDATVLNGPIVRSVKYDRALVRRARTVSGEPVFLIPVEREAQTPRSPGLFISGIGGAGCCATAAAIREQGSWLTSGPPNRMLIVVPDGVAKVSVTLRAGPDRHHPPTVTGKVRDNVIMLEIPFAAETLSGDSVTWYGRTGHVVKRFTD